MRTREKKNTEKMTKKMRFSIDIDQTIIYTDSNYSILGFNKKLIDLINKLYENGHDIIIMTGRHWDKLNLTEHQLKECGIKYNTLVMGIPSCDYYVNDRGILPEEFLNVIY